MDEPLYLTTREVAALLRVKERKVYEMAGAGQIPCRRVTGKLLFPRNEIEAWLAGDTIESETPPAHEPPAAHVVRPSVVVGSHDPLLDWALREAGTGLASFFDGSLDGLARVARGEAVACGLHVYEAETGEYNLRHVSSALAGQPFVLIEWARRRQGLLMPKGLSDQIKSMGDLDGRRVALRQPGSGGRIQFDHQLSKAGLSHDALKPTDLEARTELDAATAVASGSAEVAFGLEAMARQFNLAFLPIAEERYDIALERRFYFEPAWRRLTRLCESGAVAEKAQALGGYDVSGLGEPHWNGA